MKDMIISDLTLRSMEDSCQMQLYVLSAVLVLSRVGFSHTFLDDAISSNQTRVNSFERQPQVERVSKTPLELLQQLRLGQRCLLLYWWCSPQRQLIAHNFYLTLDLITLEMILRIILSKWLRRHRSALQRVGWSIFASFSPLLKADAI
jgi:hypothetical protein